MIQISDKTQCCGCEGCAQVCPKGCITMCSDEEGFLYPEVNQSLCIQCGLCERACPIINAEQRGDSVMQSLVAYHQQTDVRLASSSGGIFSLIAEDVLQRDGKVYGAAFKPDFSVHHIGVDTSSNLMLLRGSKYLQSSMDNTYRQVKADLQAGRKVLFSGVSCQVAGLKQFLQKDYSNLLTIDVLCHGVPSPLVWKQYLAWQESQHQGHVDQVCFRKKNNGWKHYEMELHFANGKTYHKVFSQDYYMKLFLNDICLRPSCHQCRFKSLDRKSDITLGDCWGVQNYMPEMDDDQGTSVILVHTENGKAILERLSDQMHFQYSQTDRALPPTADSRKSVQPHPKRRLFFDRLKDTNDMEVLVKMVRPGLLKRLRNKCKRYIRKIKK